MTALQLGQVLGYSNPRKGIDNLIQRNEYLKSSRFSVTLDLRATDGKSYNTRLFNEDGIYEVTFKSDTEKALEFREFVRRILKALRKGIYPQNNNAEIEYLKTKVDYIYDYLINIDVSLSDLTEKNFIYYNVIYTKLGDKQKKDSDKLFKTIKKMMDEYAGRKYKDANGEIHYILAYYELYTDFFLGTKISLQKKSNKDNYEDILKYAKENGYLEYLYPLVEAKFIN